LADLLGEAVLYITSSTYMRYEIELEILKSDIADDADDEDTLELPLDPVKGEQMDRDAAVDADDEADPKVAPKRKSKKTMSAMEARDRLFLLEYVVTSGCRRIPWNKFFGNNSKREESYTLNLSKSDLSSVGLPYPVLLGARCCDNCTPDLFPIETVRLVGGLTLKSGRRRQGKASDGELISAVKEALRTLRKSIAQREFPIYLPRCF
jgi:hypothetical protein